MSDHRTIVEGADSRRGTGLNTPYISGIPQDRVILRKQCQAFDPCLSNQQTIEWVFVERRESAYAEGVLAGNCQFTITMCQKAISEHAGITDKIGSSASVFDRSLPDRDSAEEYFVRRVIQQM
jgi:hypothetical protein